MYSPQKTAVAGQNYAAVVTGIITTVELRTSVRSSVINEFSMLDGN